MSGQHLLSVLVFTFVTQMYSSPFHKPPQIVNKLSHEVLLQFGPLHRFLLSCNADADPLPTYQWFKNTQPLAEDSAGLTLISKEEHSQLQFTSPGPNHEGFYHCEAVNSLGRAKSSLVHVTSVLSKPSAGTTAPQFVLAPENEIASVGSSVELRCGAEGVPEPSIEWTKNGYVMEGETGPKLVIESLSEADVANYACNASNAGGYVYKNVYLNVLTVAARITAGPSPDLLVSKGSNVSISCQAEGHPKPSIAWSVNGSDIVDDDKYDIDKETGQLVVLHADVSDQGEYECLARNHGEDRAEGRLTVKSVTTIVDGPRDSEAVVFSSILMNCSVVTDVSQQLTIGWKKNNVDLGQEGFPNSDRIYVDANNALNIKNLTFTDSGTYTCVAETSTSLDTDSGLLSVVGIQPRLAPAEKLPDQLEGAEVTIACEVIEGFPAAAVFWFKDGRDIDLSLVTIGQDHSLRIASAQQHHSGDYTCRAQNSEGYASLEVTLRVRKRAVIVNSPSYYLYKEGGQVMFNCQVEVDHHLQGSLQINWYKGETKLSLEPDQAESSVSESSLAGEDAPHLILLPNSSLVISGVQQSDLGYYSCEAVTALSPPVRSAHSQIYLTPQFPWWVILTAVLVIIVLLLSCICVCKYRRTVKEEGYYCVDDMEASDKKHDKSDIYYTTQDCDSVMDEMDNLTKDNSKHIKTPIFTPKTIRLLSNMDRSTGSVGSLLSNDEFLNRGMEEDGSFRERYLE